MIIRVYSTLRKYHLGMGPRGISSGLLHARVLSLASSLQLTGVAIQEVMLDPGVHIETQSPDPDARHNSMGPHSGLKFGQECLVTRPLRM